MSTCEILQGDCLEVMGRFPNNYFSAIVTDPPYGISMCGKKWDANVPSSEYWKSALRVAKPGSHLLAFGHPKTFHHLMLEIENSGWQIRDVIMWMYGTSFPKSNNHFGIKGYGTALKTVYEPVIMAMKPLDGTFKQNAQKWCQAGINIDECRIEANGELKERKVHSKSQTLLGLKDFCYTPNPKGRWPANIILDEEASKEIDEQAKSNVSRFFYCPKINQASEKTGKINHPTVKPTKLMEYLLKLVMPPDQDAICLDPFAGSGSTILAAKNLGMKSIGIEKEHEYVNIANERIS